MVFPRVKVAVRFWQISEREEKEMDDGVSLGSKTAEETAFMGF